MPDISSFVDSYSLRRLLLIIIAVLLVIVVLLFVVLISHKVLIEYRERRLRRQKELYIDTLSKRLFDPLQEIRRPKTFIEFCAIADVIIDMLLSVSGSMESQIQGFVRDLGVAQFYKNMVMSRSWLKRLTATERLGYFRLPEMKDFFHYLLEVEKDNEVIVRTIFALSMIAKDEADFKIINRFLKNPYFMSSKFNEYIYTHIIRSILRNGQSDLFLEFLKSLRDDASIPVFLKRDIIEACGSEKFHPAKDIIIDYFRHFSDTPEMKITCIRALGKMGGEDVCRIILSCLDDQDWRVRAVAAKHAYLCSLDIIGTLRRCLQDESYYVRINAATSLSRFGEQGISALREEMQSPDRFTRDVSRYIVNEVLIYA